MLASRVIWLETIPVLRTAPQTCLFVVLAPRRVCPENLVVTGWLAVKSCSLEQVLPLHLITGGQRGNKKFIVIVLEVASWLVLAKIQKC